MDLLIIVSNPACLVIAREFGTAALRKGASWGVFFTNDGVLALADETLSEIVQNADHAIACHESWKTHMGETRCPIELGSQTNHSVMVGRAERIISL